jgi:hypothetical protein
MDLPTTNIDRNPNDILSSQAIQKWIEIVFDQEVNLSEDYLKVETEIGAFLGELLEKVSKDVKSLIIKGDQLGLQSILDGLYSYQKCMNTRLTYICSSENHTKIYTIAPMLLFDEIAENSGSKEIQQVFISKKSKDLEGLNLTNFETVVILSKISSVVSVMIQELEVIVSTMDSLSKSVGSQMAKLEIGRVTLSQHILDTFSPVKFRSRTLEGADIRGLIREILKSQFNLPVEVVNSIISESTKLLQDPEFVVDTKYKKFLGKKTKLAEIIKYILLGEAVVLAIVTSNYLNQDISLVLYLVISALLSIIALAMIAGHAYTSYQVDLQRALFAQYSIAQAKMRTQNSNAPEVSADQGDPVNLFEAAGLQRTRNAFSDLYKKEK